MRDMSLLRGPQRITHRGWFAPVYPCGHPDGYCLDRDYPEYRRLWNHRDCQWCAVARGDAPRVYRLDCERVN